MGPVCQIKSESLCRIVWVHHVSLLEELDSCRQGLYSGPASRTALQQATRWHQRWSLYAAQSG